MVLNRRGPILLKIDMHVCVPTITIEGDSYRWRIAEAKRKPRRTLPER